MNSADIVRYRLANQRISLSTFERPSEVVAWLGAMQAQDYAGALWSVGLRLPDATAAAIEQALSAGAIVRTWPMRGTLHFVAPADVRWMLELLASRVIRGSAGRLRQLEIDDAVLGRSRELFAEALQGGKQLTRAAMFEVLEAAQIATTGQRGIHILSRLAHEGLLCFGTRAGKQQTFTLLEEWVPPARALQRDEALAELARLFFTGHGPATVQDLAWWAGLPLGDVRAALALVKPDLIHHELDGATHWMAGDQQGVDENRQSVHLLPGFDEYLLGYRDRSAALDPSHRQVIVPGNNGMFISTIVIEGRVAGTWRRTTGKGSAAIVPAPFEPLSEAQARGVAAAAERYARFMGRPSGAA